MIRSFMAVSPAPALGEPTKARPGRRRLFRRWPGSIWKKRACRMSPAFGAANGPSCCASRFAKAIAATPSRSRPALWGCHLANYAGKHLIVVDDDIDIHDWEAIEWALCYRVNAGLGDITTFPGTSGSMLDPSVPSEERDSVKYGHGKWTRVLIDATINWELEPQEQYGGNRYPPWVRRSRRDGRHAQKQMERVWTLRRASSL